MSIEGLGKKFQEARKARGLSLDEAARLTKIRQSRLAEIEADDFSNFPSLAYAKGFLQIYGKFLDVDVSPYLDTFETSEHITIDGYSYLQDSPPPPKSVRVPVARREGPRTSIMPLLIGLVVLFVGFWLVRLLLNVQRIAPRPTQTQTEAAATPTPAATVATITAPRAQLVDTPPQVAATSAPTRPAVVAPTAAPTAIAAATPNAPSPTPNEPEVRRAQPVRPEELAAALANSNANEPSDGQNRVDIKPLRKTYVQVTIDDDPTQPAFERWVSPSDGVVEFRGRRISVRVLDREAVQIRKNGKIVSNGDADLRIE
jgi:cytoskeletal protein RodZ